MKNNSVICICGSMRFIDEMKIWAEKLELEGNCVLSVIYPTRENVSDYSKEELALLNALHKQKIAMSDAIFVVNVDGYIGNATQSAIDFAQLNNKQVLYLYEKHAKRPLSTNS